ncbi:hypothetical protein WKI72_10610 [Candidatus Erwinia dacicola]
MYIPRPAKLLFTVDDGWNPYLEKYGDCSGQLILATALDCK